MTTRSIDSWRFVAAANLLITKARGVTLAEAFAMSLPLICYRSLPGQEARNERFAEMAGVALLARTPGDLKRTVGLAFSDPILRKLRENIRLIATPEAARAGGRGDARRGKPAG